MAGVVTLIMVVLALVWTLISLGTYLLVNGFGGLLAGNADAAFISPELVVFLSETFRFLTGLGLVAVVVVWLVGTAAILGAGLLIRRAIA